MAKQLLHVILSLLCLHFCSSSPVVTPKNISFSNFVLDNKKDCGIVNHDIGVIKLFKAHECPDYIKPFSDHYFDQRDILPCFGIYDALYRLCEFYPHKFSFKESKDLSDSKQFCVKARDVFKNVNFTYSGNGNKKWSDALRFVMQDEELCKNLCLLKNEVNDQCNVLLTVMNEYLLLKGHNQSPLEDDMPKLALPQSLSANSQQVVETAKDTVRPPILSTKHKNIGHQKLEVDITNDDTKPNKNVDGIASTVSEINTSIAAVEQKSKPTVEGQKKAVIASTPSEKNTLPNTIINEKNAIPKKNTPDLEVSVINGQNSQPEIKISHIQKIDETNIDGESIVEEIASTTVELGQENEESVPSGPNDKGSEDAEIENPNEVEKTPVMDKEQGNWNPIRDNFAESEDSYSFTYIVTTMAALCAVYLLFHYRNKLLALALEGRKGRNSRGRGRPSSANYSKLHSNLEEAIASNATAPTATHVLY